MYQCEPERWHETSAQMGSPPAKQIEMKNKNNKQKCETSVQMGSPLRKKKKPNKSAKRERKRAQLLRDT